MNYSKIINKLRINNEVSWNLTVQNWTVFISLYRSLYGYMVRVPIYWWGYLFPRCTEINAGGGGEVWMQDLGKGGSFWIIL